MELLGQRQLHILFFEEVSYCFSQWLHQSAFPIHQWNRIESPEINPSLYGRLTFDKGGRSTQWSKDILFNKWYWENWTGTSRKNIKLDQQLTLYTRINSKWIKDLNISCDTIKVLEENIGSKISDTPCSNIFAYISPRARETKEKINTWDYIKFSPFLSNEMPGQKM